MGSGKSTVGAMVAARAGVPHRDLDALIEEHSGMSVADLFAGRGELAFRELETLLLSAALDGEAVVSLGGGSVLADGNWALIRRRALTVWLDAPLPVLLVRAARVPAGIRPLLAGRTEAQVQELFEARLSRYSAADHRVDAVPPATAVAEEVYRLWVA
jgi:shikimate kinase